MGRNKRSVQKPSDSAASAPSTLPFSDITTATTNYAHMAETKGKKKTKDKADSISIKCGKGSDAHEIQCVSKPVKTYQCALPDTSANGLATELKKCAISEKPRPKKKKKDQEEQELQNLVDFIEGKDSSKENATPNASNKPKKKKKPKKPEVKDGESKESQETAKDGQSSKKQEDKAKDSKTGSKTDSAKPDKAKASKKGSAKGAETSSEVSSSASEDAVVKPKKPKKAFKPPTQEELEVMKLLQYIEGPSDQQGATVAQADSKDSSDQNNNNDKKKKSKKKKAPKAFDFNALKDNTHLEAKMIDEILSNPTCVNEYRLFNPKQVAFLFSNGHNEHWERFPQCDGRLKALERSREGMTLCDPGSKQLSLVFAELRRQRGKNITKKDFIEALKCHAFLRCEKCSYESSVLPLQ